MKFPEIHSVNQEVKLPEKYGVSLYIKREDLIHDYISGNKYRKLKYNILEAERQGKDTLLTFGGAFSNHIAAVAAAGEKFGFKTIGVIRGEELADKVDDNPTLRYAKSCGMTFCFVSRSDYRKKNSDVFLQSLAEQFGDFYPIPEGGTNNLAIKGSEEILAEDDNTFDYICCAVGTGGTISGIINSTYKHQQIIGFPALKGDFLQKDISTFVTKENWRLQTDYHFGGYAKVNAELVDFINAFKRQYQIPLDPVYTGKMMYGIMDMIKKGHFERGIKILAIHTGGIQGIAGMNSRLKQKQLPLID
ncbi:1-aminocyclopropane-1-carboxylate deaminase/D-cysteine desulfhydrase [Mangrovimonas aestuarii]|uniref:1-aminocyclopropane-1-carboxylate deaminase/D-cysteine desulfhydrase n=1 Tax=Mangrovimonas aestuarii TaxID=3018443 RepID=UPI002378BB85|nr:pyridoxal-phosphate dependent enzyme [Mangrovimonas aestuarii]